MRPLETRLTHDFFAVFRPVVSLVFTSRLTLRRQRLRVLRHELLHGLRILPRQGAERPGKRLHHHVVAIVEQQLTDRQRAGRVTAAAPGRNVERRGAGERRPPPPAVVGAAPGLDHGIGHLAFTPGRPGEIAGEGVDLLPGAHAPAEDAEPARREGAHGARVIGHQLEGDDPVPPSGRRQPFGELEHDVRRGGGDPAGPFPAKHPHGGDGVGRHRGEAGLDFGWRRNHGSLYIRREGVSA